MVCVFNCLCKFQTLRVLILVRWWLRHQFFLSFNVVETRISFQISNDFRHHSRCSCFCFLIRHTCNPRPWASLLSREFSPTQCHFIPRLDVCQCLSFWTSLTVFNIPYFCFWALIVYCSASALILPTVLINLVLGALFFVEQALSHELNVLPNRWQCYVSHFSGSALSRNPLLASSYPPQFLNCKLFVCFIQCFFRQALIQPNQSRWKMGKKEEEGKGRRG
jgi:hypothetical protein